MLHSYWGFCGWVRHPCCRLWLISVCGPSTLGLGVAAFRDSFWWQMAKHREQSKLLGRPDVTTSNLRQVRPMEDTYASLKLAGGVISAQTETVEKEHRAGINVFQVTDLGNVWVQFLLLGSCLTRLLFSLCLPKLLFRFYPVSGNSLTYL